MTTTETAEDLRAKRLQWAEERRRGHVREAWEERHTGPLKAAFLSAYGVKEYKYGYRNLRALLEQGGAGRPAADGVLDRHFGPNERYNIWIGDPNGKGMVFDHHEFYGRSRTPLFLVGHPYDVAPDGDPPYISEEAAGTIEGLRSLGMTVAVLGCGYSWYGYGTRQVVVFHLPTVRKVCGADAPDYPFLRPSDRKPWPGLAEAEKVLIPTHPWLAPRSPRPNAGLVRLSPNGEID